MSRQMKYTGATAAESSVKLFRMHIVRTLELKIDIMSTSHIGGDFIINLLVKSIDTA